MIQELHCDDYRELKIFSYRIIYRIVTENQAAIVAIVHSRRILTHEMVD